jgi:arylsulfatase
MMGSRSIYHRGWKAVTDHVSEGVIDEGLYLEGSRDLENPNWSLFHLDEDFSEAHDLAADQPETLAELEALWWEQAEANDVLPLSSGMQERIMMMEPPVWPVPRRLEVLPGFGPLADEVVPSLGGGGLLVAEVDAPPGGGEGVLAAMGDWSNGWALVVLDGRPTFLLNVVSNPFRVMAPDPLTPGAHAVGFRFRPDGTGGGTGTVLVDGLEVATETLPSGVGMSGGQIGGGGLRVGHDAGFPVSDDYQPPFPWTGTLHRVVFGADTPTPTVTTAELDQLMRRE